MTNPQTGSSSLETEVDYALVAPTFATVAGWLSVLSSGFLVHLRFLETRTMFQPNDSGASASSVPAASGSMSPSSGRWRKATPIGVSPHHETVRHMVFGSVPAVQNTIKLLYQLNYAEPNDWSKLMPTGQSNAVVTVLTKKVKG